LNGKRRIAAAALPQGHVAWVTVRQGALNQLPGHECTFGGVGLLPNGSGNLDKLNLCTGRRRKFPGKCFHGRDFSRLNQPASAALLAVHLFHPFKFLGGALDYKGGSAKAKPFRARVNTLEDIRGNPNHGRFAVFVGRFRGLHPCS
jgi:hypothetical protein